MTLTELVDLVLLAVNGGELSPEAAVLRPDVETYVPAAVHKVIRNEALRLARERRLAKQAAPSTPVLDAAFFQTFTLTAATDPVTGLKFVTLPGTTLSITGISPLETVYPSGLVDEPFVIISGPSAVASNLKDLLIQAWEQSSLSGTKVFFYGDAIEVCEVTVRAIMEVTGDAMDEEIKIPSALEYDVIELCKAHFSQQRQQPADAVLDNHDVNVPK